MRALYDPRDYDRLTIDVEHEMYQADRRAQRHTPERPARLASSSSGRLPPQAVERHPQSAIVALGQLLERERRGAAHAA